MKAKMVRNILFVADVLLAMANFYYANFAAAIVCIVGCVALYYMEVEE